MKLTPAVVLMSSFTDDLTLVGVHVNLLILHIIMLKIIFCNYFDLEIVDTHELHSLHKEKKNKYYNHEKN